MDYNLLSEAYMNNLNEEHTIIRAKGSKPPQPNIPDGMDLQDMLLFTAWIHGFDSSTAVTMWPLILFIQTHVKSVKASKIEQTLSTSLFWEKDLKNRYKVSKLGFTEIKRFGEQQPHYPVVAKYYFTTEFNEKTFGILFDENGKKTTYLDGYSTPAPLLLKKLAEAEVSIFTDATWPPEIIYDWIITQTDYIWQRNP
jgi:hypothetical protein